jgi:hypothetical protein
MLLRTLVRRDLISKAAHDDDTLGEHMECTHEEQARSYSSATRPDQGNRLHRGTEAPQRFFS